MPNNQEDNTTSATQFPVDPTSYKIVAEIGAGVSAVVYKALCLPLNSLAVAIKSIDLDSRPIRRSPSSSDSSDQLLDEARREAKTMSLFRHPNVLTAHCSFAVGRRLWVVMPFMSAGSLASIITSSFPSGLPEPAIAVFLRETLYALTYLHAQGHLHRDVKAGNILVDAATGSVKLADFGVSASIYDSPSPLTDVAGTPYWMAPEVIHSHNGYGIKADIWSFGITALELAHGRPPLSNLPLSESLVLKLTKSFRFSDFENDDDSRRSGKKFSRAFKEMVGLCLNQEPSKRPTAERLLKHSFFKSFSHKGLDFLVKSVLHGLPSVEERFRVFKISSSINNNNYNDVDDVDGDDDDDDELLKEKRRRISGWNFNEDLFELDPVFPTEFEDDSVTKQVRFGEETIIRNNDESSVSLPTQQSDYVLGEPSESSLSFPSQLGIGELVPSGIDKERVSRNLVMIKGSLEAERKTVSEIMRVLGLEEAEETREEYLERAAEALRSELEVERRRNSELEMEIEFLKMEIQRHN